MSPNPMFCAVPLLAMLGLSCEKPSDVPSPQASGSSASRSATPPNVDSSARPAPQSTIHLPAKRFTLEDVLGHSRKEVEEVLGKGDDLDDGPVLYKGFDPVGLTVTFDRDKAAVVSVMVDGATKLENVDAIFSWMHSSRGQYDIDTSSWLDVWAPGMLARQMARREAAKALSADMTKPSFAAAMGIDLEFTAPPGECDRATVKRELGHLKRLGYDAKELGFSMSECSGVLENTVVKIQ